jgi:hypothetical protein
MHVIFIFDIRIRELLLFVVSSRDRYIVIRAGVYSLLDLDCLCETAFSKNQKKQRAKRNKQEREKEMTWQ